MRYSLLVKSKACFQYSSVTFTQALLVIKLLTFLWAKNSSELIRSQTLFTQEISLGRREFLSAGMRRGIVAGHLHSQFHGSAAFLMLTCSTDFFFFCLFGSASLLAQSKMITP